eukprot:TRINITY_DN203_c0_g1_i3.p1 TRINITY_DN203_c0_g1~~TRINITY_DN203_c0_g1_i3.p1  ORF type:complete len:196 (+),score=71.39 TRINITY_DN203_c0_g1_i3:172-759(+)
MKNWKMKDKPNAIVPATTAKAGSGPKAAKGKVEERKPPLLALDGNKWNVHWQFDNKEIVLADVEPKQTIYIYKSENSVVHVKGKINNITIDGCKKVAVIFENAISAVEIVNSVSCEIQCSGRCPSFAIDKTTGLQLYLTTAAGLDTEIVQSKSSSMNILVPGATPNDDLVELAVPEQFKTLIKNKALITTPVVHV